MHIVRNFQILKVPADPIRVGSFADVRVIDSASHYLMGELIAVTARPRHRTRIAISVG